MSYEHAGPTVWHGLPDLRDKSKDLTLWSGLPVPCWHVAHLLGLRKPNVYKMISEGVVEATEVLGRRCIKLGSLPQTARCQYIEHLFRDYLVPDNILHRSKTICAAMRITRKGLKVLYDTGQIEREYLPTGSPRYPHWGLTVHAQREVAEYISRQLKQESNVQS